MCNSPTVFELRTAMFNFFLDNSSFLVMNCFHLFEYHWYVLTGKQQQIQRSMYFQYFLWGLRLLTFFIHSSFHHLVFISTEKEDIFRILEISYCVKQTEICNIETFRMSYCIEETNCYNYIFSRRRKISTAMNELCHILLQLEINNIFLIPFLFSITYNGSSLFTPTSTIKSIKYNMVT